MSDPRCRVGLAVERQRPAVFGLDRRPSIGERELEPTEKVLIVFAMLNLLAGFVLGVPFAVERRHKKYAPRYLVAAHIGALMQGAILLGLVFALRLSRLPYWLELWAASMLALSSVALVAKDVANWIMKIDDEFAERPLPARVLGATGVLAGFVGIIILTLGVAAEIL